MVLLWKCDCFGSPKIGYIKWAVAIFTHGEYIYFFSSIPILGSARDDLIFFSYCRSWRIHCFGFRWYQFQSIVCKCGLEKWRWRADEEQDLYLAYRSDSRDWRRGMSLPQEWRYLKSVMYSKQIGWFYKLTFPFFLFFFF